jgi:hypothetical protein
MVGMNSMSVVSDGLSVRPSHRPSDVDRQVSARKDKLWVT